MSRIKTKKPFLKEAEPLIKEANTQTLFDELLEEKNASNVSPVKYEVFRKIQWQNYVPLPTIQIIVRHTIAVAFVIVCSAFTAWLANLFFPDDPLIHWIESIGLSVLILFLLYRCFPEIMKDENNGKNSE